MSEYLTSSLESGHFTLTLNRPDKRNALNHGMIDELHAELERADLDAAVRIVIVRGAGPDFCAGADLAELLDSAKLSLEENIAQAAHLGDVFVKMRELPKVVVAVVHGRALAGGCGLATACDLVLAHEHATFGYPEVQRGFVPAMVMAMLRRAVGEKTAFDLVGTGRSVSAIEAVAMGLASRVIPADDFDAGVQKTLDEISSRSMSALSLIKRQLYELDGRSFRDAVRLGAEVNAVARTTPDFHAAVASFLKR